MLKAPKILGGLKKPVTAFFEFLADMRSSNGIDMSGMDPKKAASEFAKRGGTMWKTMTDAQKQVSVQSLMWMEEC